MLPMLINGPDGISNWILNWILKKPVFSVLSSSYKEQRLSSSWKYADVTPLPK
jgi:diketogulonate reductase-like aldo/keto reductase